MATILLRTANSISHTGATVKGTPLTNSEVDNNFSNINITLGVLSNLSTTANANLVSAINSITYAVGSSGNVLTSNGNVWASTSLPASGLSYVAKSANYTINNNEGVLANTATGAFTITLPISPVVGNQVVVADAGGDFGANALTIARNGSTIANAAEDLICDINDVSVQLVYSGSTWEVYSQIGGNAGSSKITIVDETSSSSTFYPILSMNTSGQNTGNVSSTKLTFTPSTGTLVSTDYNSSSDMTLKQDFTPIKNPLDIISQLTGFGFTWKDSKEKAFGLSAQEVEKVIPEIVKDRPDGTKGINYMNLTAFLIEAIKDLKQEVTELKKHK
jgi:hypothetical protein